MLHDCVFLTEINWIANHLHYKISVLGNKVRLRQACTCIKSSQSIFWQ